MSSTESSIYCTRCGLPITRCRCVHADVKSERLEKENAELKKLLSEEIIDNALLNYIESFSLSMLPQSVEYLEYAEKLKNKATEVLRKIRSLKNEN